MNILTKLKTVDVSNSIGQTTRFGQLGLISDPHRIFQIASNGLNDHKGSENIYYTIVKYRETSDMETFTAHLSEGYF